MFSKILIPFFCMNNSKKLLIIIVISLFCKNIFAQTRNGIYGETFSQSMMISVGANYYFGDIEKVGIFSSYWKSQVNGFGQIAYIKRIYKETFNVRVNLLAAALNGEKNDLFFKNFIIEPGVMLEIFPFTITKDKMCNCLKKTVGLYLYGGAGLAFYSVNLTTPNKTIKYNSYAPMAALGVGYRFNVMARLELGIEVGYRFAAIDKLNISLDGYPYRDDNGVIVGKISSNWNDGFYTFGVTVGYKF